MPASSQGIPNVGHTVHNEWEMVGHHSQPIACADPSPKPSSRWQLGCPAGDQARLCCIFRLSRKNRIFFLRIRFYIYIISLAAWGLSCGTGDLVP